MGWEGTDNDTIAGGWTVDDEIPNFPTYNPQTGKYEYPQSKGGGSLPVPKSGGSWWKNLFGLGGGGSNVNWGNWLQLAGTLYGMWDSRQQCKKQDDVLKQQQDIYKQVQPDARNFLNQSRDAFNSALGYYGGVLANPREATAPEQNRIGTMYAGQAQNARSQQPRGGFGAAAAENIRGQQRAANENVIQQARPNAAGALANLGGATGQLGFQGYGLGAGILGNVFNQGMAARQMAFQQGSALGQGFYNAYQNYLLNRAMQDPGNSNAGGSTGVVGNMGGNDYGCYSNYGGVF